MNDHIDPTSSSYIPDHGSFRQEENLKYHAGLVQMTIGYAASDPKEFSQTFLNIAILMHMEQRRILTSEEGTKISDAFQKIHEGIYDGSLKIHQIPALVETLVQETKKNNEKAQVVASIVELEHLICVYPPHGQTAREFREFDNYVAPIFAILQQNISRNTITKLHKEIEEVKFFLSERGSIAEALSKLADCQGIIGEENR